MKKFTLLFIILLLAISVLPIGAQQGACFIDLSAAAATLVQAQAQASSGDTVASLAKLRELQAQLASIIANCESGTSAVLPTPAPVVTPSTPLIESPYTTSNGAFSFTLPAGWGVFERGNSVFIGTSEATATNMTQFSLPMPDSEIGMALVVGSVQELAPTVRTGANFVDVLLAYQTEMSLIGLEMGELMPITLSDRPGGRFIFQSADFLGVVMVIEYAPNGLHLLILVKAHPSMNQQIEERLASVANSVLINP